VPPSSELQASSDVGGDCGSRNVLPRGPQSVVEVGCEVGLESRGSQSFIDVGFEVELESRALAVAIECWCCCGENF
jgi:hypothetical protein